MPNLKISELSPCDPLSGSEIFPIIQRDINNKNVPSTFTATVRQLSDFVNDYIIPPGTIWMYTAPVVRKDLLPPGWLLCDGTSYPVSRFSKLYKVIRDSYGLTPTPGITFRVPDIRGRFLLGFSSYNRDLVPNFGSFLGQALVMGRIDGEFTSTLSEDTIPLHKHNLVDNTPPRNYLHHPASKAIPADAGIGIRNVEQLQGDATGFFEHIFGASPDGRPDGPGSDRNFISLGGIDCKSRGESQPHPNTPPYICLNHIIKY